MKKILTLAATAALLIATNQSNAVELLISGDFETPGGSVGEVPGWTLVETITGSSDSVDSASINPGDDSVLFLKAFAGGGPFTPAQGNFDGSNMPAGLVDGRDFLIWQRNVATAGATPAQGDATGDTVVNGSDLGIWQSNYGQNNAGRFSNARLIQSVPGIPGETYSFTGSVEFEQNYSGFVTTLGDRSPHGQIASPTTTQFRLEFLNASNVVIGAPVILDLRPVVTDPDFPVTPDPLTAVAPAGTANVRVVAEALNMAWNGNSSQTTVGEFQSAFFNDFVLDRSGNPGTNLLTNGDLNAGIPDALDFWNQVERPTDFTPFDEILRTPVAGFSNHTPGGTRGVWLSAFFGFADPPGDGVWSTDEGVDGIISQEVGAVPGATYTFSGWTKFEANYSGGVDNVVPGASGLYTGPSPTETEIRLDFLDAAENVIESAVIDVREARRLLSPTMNANDNIWYQHVLQAIAPAGTVEARLTAQMLDGVFNFGGGQSAFFDDFSLDGPAPPGGLLANVSVPEPSSMLILASGAMLLGMGRNRR